MYWVCDETGKQKFTLNTMRYIECMMKQDGNSIRLTAFEY